jgi:TatD DNase family protein
VQLPKAVKKEKWTKGMMVKGRNEPACIVHVAHAVAKIKGLSVEELCEACVSVPIMTLTYLSSAWNNSINMFGLGVPAPN